MKSRRAQIAEARRLGLRVEPVRRTGEVRFVSPLEDVPPVTINNRRKDGTRAVAKLLERHRPDEAQESTTMPTTHRTPPLKPTAEEVAHAFVKGRTTEDVIRAMAAEPKADIRLKALVARYDVKRARINATKGATK